MPYFIVFAKDLPPRSFEQGTLLGRAMTLPEAAAIRKSSGDLVMNAETGHIEQDPSWLWPWEFNHHSSYAFQRIKHKARLSKKALTQLRTISPGDSFYS